MASILEEYSRDYYPAAPVIKILVDGYDNSVDKQSLNALLDTGADATMMPLDVLQNVNAPTRGNSQMRGVIGNSETVFRYLIAVEIGAIRVKGIRAVAMPVGSEAIIGRDVLNQLTVTLDGPALSLRIDV